MSAYRTSARKPETEPTLTYDYAKAVERNKAGVVSTSLRLIAGLVVVVGFYPFVALFGGPGLLIAVGVFGFIAVPLAIRSANVSTGERLEAYETTLLRKARSRRKS